MLVVGASALLFGVTSASAQLVQKWFGTSKFVAVLVDVSMSVSDDDRKIYVATFGRMIDALGPEDRVVLVPVSDRSLTGFVANVDVVLPKDSGSLRDKERLQHARSDLNGAFLARLDGAKSKKTFLLDGFNVCQQLFEADKGKKRKERWIIVLSDMLEDSDYGDFERMKLTSDVVSTLLERRRAAGSLPRLDGVRVWVAGARAKNMAKFNEVREFWERYLKETGARLEPGAYVRDGLQFK